MQTAPQNGGVLQFGRFEVDFRLGELRKGGVKVKVQELPFRALRFLLDHPNEVLSREQFRHALWPEGVFVDFDHSISSTINRLRDALGDSADNPIFIETVERRGYRWIAPIHIPAPAPKPGPVPVQAEPQKQFDAAPRPQLRWRWSLVFPAAALALAVWAIWPGHRAAKAGSTQPPPVKSTSPELKGGSARAEAEQFYLKGRFYWEKRTPDGLNRALDYFTQAIVHDPNYAAAYVGLADCYNLLREYTIMPASDAYPRALAAAQRAVELDDQSSEAHASLAFALFWGNWDAAAAEREFRRAIELNPNNACARHWYATYLSMVGRHAESLAEIERAQTLEPASKAILADKGNLLCAAGRCDEGVSLLKQVEGADPDFVSPHRYLKEVYFRQGSFPGYLKEWKQEVTLLKDGSALRLVDAAEKGYAQAGARGMLQNIRALETSLYEDGSLSPYTLAQTDALLGNSQEALQFLKLAYDRHDELVVQVKVDYAFNNLHNEPAYQDLVKRVGLPVNK